LPAFRARNVTVGGPVRNPGSAGGKAEAMVVREREVGGALVEAALLLPLVVLLIAAMLDFGRAWQLQNRLSNSAREAAQVVQFWPLQVSSGCAGGNNATDRARGEDAGLASTPGYTVEVRTTTGDLITGCGTSPAAVSPGDRLVVTVSARMDLITPVAGALVGDPLTVTRSVEVVVQG
jgi:hypothetical protein